MIGRMVRRWTRHYGAHPLHLLAVLMVFAVIGYAVSFLLPDPTALTILIWFLGAVVVHDALMFPLYAVLDRIVSVLHPKHGRPRRRVPVVNHVRLPALFSALVFVMFLPSISGHSEPTFAGTAGRSLGPHLENWVLLTVGLFVASAALYVLRLVRFVLLDRRRRVAAGADHEHSGELPEPPPERDGEAVTGQRPAESGPATRRGELQSDVDTAEHDQLDLRARACDHELRPERRVQG